jgi:hypothetical protein
MNNISTHLFSGIVLVTKWFVCNASIRDEKALERIRGA